MATIYLAHVTVYDPSISGQRTLYFSSAGFVTGTANLPPGGVSHTFYDNRISQPANMRRDVFSNGTTGGASQVGYGALELTNIDGGLDGFADYGFDGLPFTLILGEVVRGSAPVWTTVLVGTMEQPEISWSKVSIRLRDRQAEMSKPASPNKFGGTNALPSGLDGVAGDLKGKAKPRIYGRVFNVSPPCVNTSRLIYQVNDGAIAALDAVYDRGVLLTAGAVYASQADMETNAPSAGQYRVWLAGGFFRLGSSPAGTVTVDAAQGANAAARTVAQLAYAIVTGPGAVLAADVTSADLSALDALNGAEVGVWAGEMTCHEALDALCASIGAWWSFDRLGKFRMGRLEAPAGSPTADITAADIISIDRVPSNDPGRGVSAWQLTLAYKKFWTVQSTDLAGSVTDARRAELREESRRITVSDAAIKTKHALAPALSINTLLVDATAAGTEASRLLALYKAERMTLELKVGFDGGLIAGIDLGNTIRLTVPRFGMSAGRLFIVTGIRSDLKNKFLYLTLWG